MTTVRRISPVDDAVFDELYDLYQRAFDRDFDQPYGPLEKKVALRPDAYMDNIVLLARAGSAVAVGGAWAQLPLMDNLGFAFVDLFVAPEHRRKGHGRALIGALVEAVRAAGRTTVLAEAVWGLDDDEAPARAFSEACGFTLDILDAHRELRLPASLPPLVVDLAYEIRSWRGACPEEWIDGYADVRRLMVQESPSGDAGLENEHWDRARIRREEEQWANQGRTPQVSVALAEDGLLVGHTQLLFPGSSEEVYQWDTIVLPAHRGHGLGLALKVFTMKQASDLLEGRRRIHTYNAASNTHMIAVNEAMGFRQVAWVGEYVRSV